MLEGVHHIMIEKYLKNRNIYKNFRYNSIETREADLTNAFIRTIINTTSRDGAVWKLVGLITRRSQVQILLPQFQKAFTLKCE